MPSNTAVVVHDGRILTITFSTFSISVPAENAALWDGDPLPYVLDLDNCGNGFKFYDTEDNLVFGYEINRRDDIPSLEAAAEIIETVKREDAVNETVNAVRKSKDKNKQKDYQSESPQQTSTQSSPQATLFVPSPFKTTSRLHRLASSSSAPSSHSPSTRTGNPVTPEGAPRTVGEVPFHSSDKPLSHKQRRQSSPGAPPRFYGPFDIKGRRPSLETSYEGTAYLDRRAPKEEVPANRKENRIPSFNARTRRARTPSPSPIRGMRPAHRKEASAEPRKPSTGMANFDRAKGWGKPDIMKVRDTSSSLASAGGKKRENIPPPRKQDFARQEERNIDHEVEVSYLGTRPAKGPSPTAGLPSRSGNTPSFATPSPTKPTTNPAKIPSAQHPSPTKHPSKSSPPSNTSRPSLQPATSSTSTPTQSSPLKPNAPKPPPHRPAPLSNTPLHLPQTSKRALQISPALSTSASNETRSSQQKGGKSPAMKRRRSNATAADPDLEFESESDEEMGKSESDDEMAKSEDRKGHWG
ncbi:MAG: hypothetical protein Q9168_006604 [Polycauliona sp. 1 TL-2023]